MAPSDKNTETKKVKMKLSKFQKYLLRKALKNETDKIQLELENNNSEIIRESIGDLLFQYMEIHNQIKK
jgi:hypothetical protein